jgi:hypothetical protein
MGSFVKSYVVNNSPLTGTALTNSTDMTLGAPLAGALAYRLSVVAPVGAVITGGGFNIYLAHTPDFPIWAPGNPAFDGVLPTGSRFAVMPDQLIGVGSGRLAVVPVGVTLSLGTTITLVLIVSYR